MKTHRWLIVLVVGIFVYTLYMVIQILVDLDAQRQRAEGNALRCTVFTEQIQPGMARSEVEKILDRYGPYTVGQADFCEGNYSLRIRYTDPETWDRFGSDIYVNFQNHKSLLGWVSPLRCVTGRSPLLKGLSTGSHLPG